MEYSVELIPPEGVATVSLMRSELNNGGWQSMAKAEFASQALLLGDWQLKIQRKGAIDLKSLSSGELRNAYLILGFNAS